MKFVDNEIDPTIIHHEPKNTCIFGTIKNISFRNLNNANVLHEMTEEKCIKLDSNFKASRPKSCKKISIMI
jgi:hypothetical protein